MARITQTQPVGDSLVRDAKILLIDDDDQWLTMVVDRLSRDSEDFDIVTAPSLEIGQRHLAYHSFDCVLCNYRVRNGTAFDLLGEIRESHPDIPFILVTLCGDEAIAAKGIKKGVTDYVQKELIREDFDTSGESALGTILRKAIQRYRTQRALINLSPSDTLQSRNHDSIQQLARTLTKRQQEILLQAFEEAYFEFPRKTDIQEIAEKIDTEQAVVAQQLRQAQQKLCRKIFTDGGSQ